MTKIRAFQRGETVPIWAEVRDWLGAAVSPSEGLTMPITDPNGRQVGNISVTASASFTVGLVVTGGTSGAVGLVIKIVDGTTLQLSQVVGTWVSAEAITDTGAGTSTTSSVLVDVDMVETPGGSGNYVYYYVSQASDAKGWWRCQAKSQDGLGGDARYTITGGGFTLE